MHTLTADFLTNLAAELSSSLIPALARRLGNTWQGDASARAIAASLSTGLMALAMQANATTSDEEALLGDIFRDFFYRPNVYPHLLMLARGNEPDISEMAFLFADAGYATAKLPGLDFTQGMKAFSTAFLAQAASEPALQGVIGATQTLQQTRLLRDLVAQAQELVTILRQQPGGHVQAGNYVVGTQIIYQWGGGAGPQTLEAAYLRTLIGRCNRLNLAEVDEQLLGDGGDEVQVTDVFTTLYAVREEQLLTRTQGQTVADALRVQQRRPDRETPAKGEEPLTAVSVAGALPHLVILGQPGGGKSTLVNYLATQLARRRLNPALPPLPDWPATSLLPVRIILRHFATWLLNRYPVNAQANEGLVWRYLQEELLADWGCSQVYDHLWRVLHEEGGVLFFDGLDEVPQRVDDTRRSLMQKAILAFARPLEKVKLILTCRTYAYKKGDAWWLPEAQYPVIDLPLFQEVQIRQFAQTWYQVVGPRLEWQPEQQRQKAERLATAVLAKPHLRELGQYPLLLTLMAQVHIKHDLPENRAELYDLAVNLLLAHWENRLVRQEDGTQHRELGLIARLGLRRDEVRSVLQQLAFTVHERQEGQQQGKEKVVAGGAADISRDELWDGFRPLVEGYDRAIEVTEYIQTRAGLLQAQAGGTYSFPHRTFQEFLAATHVWSLPDAAQALYERLQRDVTWWQEVFLLAAGHVREQAGSVYMLLNRLVPEKPTGDGVSGWQLTRAMLAAQAIYETNFRRFVRGQKEADHPYLLLMARVRAWLELALVAESSLLPRQRAPAGRALGGWLEDTRPGVGVIERPDGVKLPAIAWSAEEIPAGTYTIGDERGGSDEKIRPAKIERPYRLARYPITHAQFQCFLDAPDRDDSAWWLGIPDKERQFSEPRWAYGNHPREMVSWYQAMAFCKWLTQKLHQGLLPAGPLTGDRQQYIITLPHEYEWEVAARWPNEGVRERIYPWGVEFKATKANTYKGERVGQTTAVGLYPSGKNTVLDLYDLSGNVWEWCRNRYHEPESDREVDKVDISNTSRVLRGGSWDLNQDVARAASRGACGPGPRFDVVGFRVVVGVAVVRPPSHHPDH